MGGRLKKMTKKMFDKKTWEESLKKLKKEETLTGIPSEKGTTIGTYEEKEKTRLGLDVWIEQLEQEEQPTCNIDNPEDCENCGS